MKWITRERPKIDRIACPWLIARFIDKEPEFLYVPAREVLAVAAETGAIPYDILSVVTHFDVPIFTFSEGHFGRGVDRGTPRALRASGVCS
jgi:hypothetical protein